MYLGGLNYGGNGNRFRDAIVKEIDLWGGRILVY